MKFLSLFALLISFNLYATPVDGEIFYQLPDGKMAVRNVTIDVPARGQGEVVLYNDKFQWKSKDFNSKMKNGKKVFSVVFNSEFMGQKAKIKLKGTYFKSNDHIKYYGDMYKAKANNELSYIGGFEFNYAR